jgi:hypothetical protein
MVKMPEVTSLFGKVWTKSSKDPNRRRIEKRRAFMMILKSDELDWRCQLAVWDKASSVRMNALRMSLSHDLLRISKTFLWENPLSNA